MAYQMAPTLVTLSDLGGHFSCLNFFKLQMSANVAYISSDIFTEEFKPYTYPPVQQTHESRYDTPTIN